MVSPIPRLRQIVAQSARLRVVRIVVEDFPALAATLALWTLARAFLPVASLFAMGKMVSDLGHASTQVAGSLHRLELATVVFAVVYVLQAGVGIAFGFAYAVWLMYW